MTYRGTLIVVKDCNEVVYTNCMAIGHLYLGDINAKSLNWQSIQPLVFYNQQQNLTVLMHPQQSQNQIQYAITILSFFFCVAVHLSIMVHVL